jgi:hypothetical protein
MFSMIVLQLRELQFPIFLFRLVPDREFKTKLVELRFSFKIHSVNFKEGTLSVDLAQLWVKAVLAWHLTYNAHPAIKRIVCERLLKPGCLGGLLPFVFVRQ